MSTIVEQFVHFAVNKTLLQRQNNDCYPTRLHSPAAEKTLETPRFFVSSHSRHCHKILYFFTCYGSQKFPTSTMTIKVEREALITVLTRRPTWPSSLCEATSISTDDDEFVVVNLPSKSPYLDTERLRCSPYSDEDSVCTLSTSSDSLSSDSSLERRVSFASSLVTDVWTRPFTEREEIPSLFYSTEDTNR